MSARRDGLMAGCDTSVVVAATVMLHQATRLLDRMKSAHLFKGQQRDLAHIALHDSLEALLDA